MTANASLIDPNRKDAQTPNMGLRAALLAGTAIMVLGLAKPAMGQHVWTGDESTVWENGLNWNTAFPPNGGSTIIRGGTDFSPVINTSVNPTGVLRVGDTTGGSAWLTIEGNGALQSTIGRLGYSAGESGTVSVNGEDASWTLSGNLLLGFEPESEGVLEMQNGATVTVSGSTVIGQAVDSTGELEIIDATLISNGDASIGAGENSDGTVLVSGGGARWDIASSLFVVPSFSSSADATGMLTITDGATVDVQWDAFIGGRGQGTVIVSDGGRLDIGSFTIVGDQNGADGALRIESGGIVNAGLGTVSGLTIGGIAGSEGSVVVTGDGSELNVESLSVGASGDGELEISAGGLVTSVGNSWIGLSGEGAALVAGTDSEWDIGGDLVVGDVGIGTLNVSDGGYVDVAGVSIIGNEDGSEGYLNVSASGGDTTLFYSSNDVIFGALAGSYGEGSITGANAEFDASADLYIGAAGHGVLTVSDGAELDISLDAYIGYQAGSTGELTIDSGTLDASINELVVGYEGSGSLTLVNASLFEGNLIVGQEDGADGTVLIASGSTAQIRDHIRLGEEEGSTGAMTVTGDGTVVEAYTSDDYDIRVGLEGAGTLDILDEALVKDVDGLRIGALGSVTVDGEDTRLEVTDDIRVGSSDAGVGMLRIRNGGTVTAAEVIVGRVDDDSGEVEIDGEDSLLSVTGDLTLGGEEDAQGTLSISNGAMAEVGGEILVGGNGSGAFGTPVGTLNITDGGKLHSTHAGILGPMTVGYFDGATGEVTVTGDGSEIDMGGNALRIGHGGSGSLVVGQGATVLSHNGRIGNLASGSGEVTVTGNGSSWQMTNPLSVGYSGTGELTIADGGTVSASIGDIGYNIDSEGTVLVTGDGSELSLTSTLIVGRGGDGTLTVAEGGAVVADGIGLANDVGTTGTINIGAAAADNAAGAGELTLASNTLAFGSGLATLVFNHTGTQADNYVFDVDLVSNAPASQTGPGWDTIEHLAGVTNYTGDGSGFTGTTTISGSTLYVQNALGGSIDIGGSGRLGGVGTLGDVTVGAGGTIAPGNSIGTLSVEDIIFASGSIYEVELNDGGNTAGTHNDLIEADTATIEAGAIFHVVPENGTDDGSTYTPNTQYTIIETAAAGNLTVNGDPDITDDFAFLSFTGHHDGQNYYLTSSEAAASFCLPGASFNQCQTGDAVHELGSGHDAFDAVVGMSEANANAAFNALSGEVHASGQHVIENTFALFNRTLRQQGITGIGGGSGNDVMTEPLGYAPTAQAAAGVGAIDDATAAYADSRVANAWLAPLGGRGTIDSDGNAATLDWWSAGLAGGYEGQIDLGTGKGFAGFGLGYIRSHGSVDARLSTFDADGFHIGAYGGWEDGPWTLAGSLAYAANRISTERRIVFGGIDQTANASYWNHTIGFSGEALYGFDMGGGTTLSPLFTLDAGWSGHGGFTETGAGALSLTGASESWTRLDTGFGIALQHVVLTESGRVTLDGRAVWEHAFADVVPSQSLAFAGSAAGFNVRGPAASRDRLRVGAGLAWDVAPDMTIRANYDGLFSSDQSSHSGSIGLNVRF